MWRKSSFSPAANCVELADEGDRIALRNSNHRDAGTLHVTRPALAAFLDAIKAGAL